jgi:hypothetical protein
MKQLKQVDLDWLEHLLVPLFNAKHLKRQK